MSKEQFAFAGQADVYMRFLDPALDTGFFLCGDINEMIITTEAKEEKLPSNQKTRRGTLAVLTGEVTHQLSMKSKYFDKRTFAMRAGGVVSETALTAQTITDEEITVTKVGGMYPLAHQNIDTATAITAKKGSAPLTEADFDIVDGFFAAKLGGALSDGDKVKVTYKTKATNEVRVKAGKRDKYAVAIKYKGINIADNDTPFNMDIWRAEISPEGGASWIGETFGEASFTGAVILADGKDEPYEYATYSD